MNHRGGDLGTIAWLWNYLGVVAQLLDRSQDWDRVEKSDLEPACTISMSRVRHLTNRLWHPPLPRNVQRSEREVQNPITSRTARHTRSRSSAGRSSATEQRAAQGQ